MSVTHSKPFNVTLSTTSRLIPGIMLIYRAEATRLAMAAGVEVSCADPRRGAPSKNTPNTTARRTAALGATPMLGGMLDKTACMLLGSCLRGLLEQHSVAGPWCATAFPLMHPGVTAGPALQQAVTLVCRR